MTVLLLDLQPIYRLWLSAYLRIQTLHVILLGFLVNIFTLDFIRDFMISNLNVITNILSFKIQRN